MHWILECFPGGSHPWQAGVGPWIHHQRGTRVPLSLFPKGVGCNLSSPPPKLNSAIHAVCSGSSGFIGTN